MTSDLIAVVRKDTREPAGYVTAGELASGRYADKIIPDPEQHPDLKQDGGRRANAPEPTAEEREIERAGREHLADQIRGIMVDNVTTAPVVGGKVVAGPSATTSASTATAPSSGAGTTSTGA